MSDPTGAPDRTREHRTLFAVQLSDPRERRQVAGERGKGPARTGSATSDVGRVRAMAIGTAAAAVGVTAALVWVPAPPSPTSGALALPHRAAGLSCESCHREGEPSAARACTGCHGSHPSIRPAHRALMEQGALGCASCHDVHGADQGVRLSAAGEVVRYGVGAERVEPHGAPRGAHDLTVPLVPLARCTPCHDPARARDPIARCVLESQRGRSGALSVCFDEHQRWSAVEPVRAGGVCAQQHENARFAAWEAAREVADASPEAPRAGNPRAPWWWLGSGAFAGVLGLAAGSLLSRRRRDRPAPALMRPADRVRLPQIDAATCLGCNACVDACPFDVLAVERYVAVVVRPEACCGLTLCEQVCPNGSLVITDGEPIGDRPRLDVDLQARDQPGVYLAGDVTGLPLIKNAIVQGSRVLDAIAASLAGEEPHPDLDLLIVGAGPAGISAALRAQELGLRYRVIEQGTVAQSIKSFPRGKLIYDQPLELPLAGKLWLEESTKEELLAKWLRIVREERLVIDEGRRFVALERGAGGFVVEAQDAAEPELHHRYRAARVLLCIGMRGSPRKLPIELSAGAESHVFYHLADAQSFAGQRVLIVGLGDVAMEAAIALARQEGTRVTVAHRGEGFSRGKPRNIAELKRLIDAGRVELWWRAEVVGVEPGQVTLRVDGERRHLASDAVFVLIGAVPPLELLARAGVRVTDPSDPATVS